MALRPPSRDFTLPAAGGPATCIERVAPCIDMVRDIQTKLGLRQYVVSLVRTRWTGGERGDGVEQVVSTEPLLPVPKVQELVALSATNTNVGEQEFGSLTVSEISIRYTEAQLTGAPVGVDENFYWEIEFVGGQQPAQRKRRFTVNAPPSQNPENFEWTIKLARALEDRTELGEPRG